MIIIKPAANFESGPTYQTALTTIEKAARTCYQSFDKIEEGSAEKLIKSCLRRGHMSIFEHVAIGYRLITDRGVTHELVRHRTGIAFSQESTRYVRYNGDMQFVEPWWFDMPGNELKREAFLKAVARAENYYSEMLAFGASPQEARAVLPNAVKTEIVVTANIREWLHIIDLRTSPAAHPDMIRLIKLVQEDLLVRYPVFFSVV